MPKYRFSEIAINVTDKRMPVPEDKDLYIAPNNLDTDTLSVPEYGYKVDLNSTKLIMHKGDMLFGRREPQLKKAAVAPHDGLFSAHGMIFHPREEVITKEFFPFFISSDYFFDAAIRISVGSLSPTVNWKDLKDLEFDIPDLSAQQEYARVLWAMIRAKKAYKELVKKTDDLVKSQFIEMFEGRGYETVKAKSFMYNMRNGVSPSKKGSHAEKVLTLSAVTQGTFDPDAWKDGLFDECPPSDKRIHTSEFYMCRGNGNKTLVGTAVFSLEERNDLVFPDMVIAAQIDSSIVLMPYLFVAWKMPRVREQIESSARTTNGTYHINQTVLSNVELVVPPIDKQTEFVSFVEQCDKSKFAALKTLKEITDAQKALMKRIFE